MALVKGTNCGFVTSAPTSDPNERTINGEGQAIANKDTSPATAAKITEIGWWLDNNLVGTNYDVGIYSWDTDNDKPDELIGVIRNQSVSGPGWEVVEVDIDIEASTPYGIAIQIDTSGIGSVDINYSYLSGEVRHIKTSQTALTDPWGTTSTTSTAWRAIYAVWEVASATNIDESDEVTLSDNLTIDKVGTDYTSNLNETFSLSDNLGGKSNYNRTLSENVTSNDNINSLSNYNRLFVDNPLIVDNVVDSVGFNKVLSDTQPINDSLISSQEFTENISDTITVQDNVVEIKQIILNILDSISISDSINTGGGSNISIELSDTLNYSDTLNTIRNVLLALSDIQLLSDAPKPQSEIIRQLLDSQTIQDNLNKSSEFLRLITDVQSIVDNLSRGGDVSLTLSDGVTISDNLNTISALINILSKLFILGKTQDIKLVRDTSSLKLNTEEVKNLITDKLIKLKKGGNLKI